MQNDNETMPNRRHPQAITQTNNKYITFPLSCHRQSHIHTRCVMHIKIISAIALFTQVWL